MSIFDPDGNVRPRRTWAYGCATALALFVVLPIGLWAFGVFASGTKGTGDLTRQRNSAGNRAHWSATLNGLDQQITADQAMISAAHAVAAAPNATKQDQINLTGLVQNCLTDVAAYNGDTQNVLAVVPDGLPTTIYTNACGG
jgi:hypothetical protein